MTLGFTDSRFCGDFSCVFSLDFDHTAMLTHSANFGGSHLVMDIEQFLLSGSPLPAADVVIGGPPCQGFSLLNKDRSGDPRRALWEPFLEVVFRSGASVFVMENVAELLRSPEMAEINSRAEQNGFLLHAAVLNAADYGAPQVRKRTVSIGAKADLFPFGIPLPDPTHSGRWRTVREAIGDLPEPVGTEIRDEPPPLDLHFGRNPTAMSLERYRPSLRAETGSTFKTTPPTFFLNAGGRKRPEARTFSAACGGTGLRSLSGLNFSSRKRGAISIPKTIVP